MQDARELPAGIVTFVFTDIEGSTRLFRKLGPRYEDVLLRHHELLRGAWARHRGHEVKTEGDAFFVAFSDRDDALSACAEAQRLLAAHPWPPEADVRVRMGVHTGPASPRDDDYIAYAVHQAARVVSAANGGQVLVTPDAAHDTDHARRGRLESQGLHVVRDFDEPVELFMLLVDGLEPTRLPLRVMPANRHNLLRPTTTFIGRDDDVIALTQHLAASRVVSLVGPGGLGKTRLAVEWGLLNAPEIADGVWFVDLAPHEDPQAVPAAIAHGVQAPRTDDADAWTCLLDHLRSRAAVIIFDNCEHVAAAAASAVHRLLEACPAVRVLTTTREPLGLRGERILRLQPLGERAGAELFGERSGRVLDDVTRPSVEALCEALDGLPLAIELAASLADVMPPGEIVRRLDRRSGLLRTADPGVADRQRSLESLIDWGYQLLSPVERSGVRSLSVFAGGFDLQAGAACTSDDDPDEALDIIWSLVSKSFIRVVSDLGEPRYRMFATIRRHVQQSLATPDELVTAARRAADHFLESFGPEVEKRDPGLVWTISAEVDNLRGLIGWLRHEHTSKAQALASVVVGAISRESRREALDACNGFLAQLDTTGPERVLLLIRAAGLAMDCGEETTARNALRDAELEADLIELPPWLEGWTPHVRALIECATGSPAEASRVVRGALETARSDAGRARLYATLAITGNESGDLELARWGGEHAVDLFLAHGNDANALVCLSTLAETELRAGRLAVAARRQLESLDLAMTLGDAREIAFAMVVAARLAGHAGAWTTAGSLQLAADHALAKMGFVLLPTDREACDRLLAEVRRELGDDRFAELPAADDDQALLSTREVLTSWTNSPG